MKIKYPRTYHLPMSLGTTSDDKMHRDLSNFLGKDCLITKKMDGENTTLYSWDMHARSTTYAPHPSRDWLRSEHAKVGYKIPENWRVCGENLFAKHSIQYADLESYFYIFSVWTDENVCLPWDETITWADHLGFPVVDTIYRGIISEEVISETIASLDTDVCEGFVIRPTDGFHYDDFTNVVGKWVRKGHVQTDKHWMHSEIVKNSLKE
jgi:hypothetical protein